MMPQVAVVCESPNRLSEAKGLAADLDAPVFLGIPLGEFQFLLCYTDERLELRLTGDDAPGPVFADFIGGALDYRRRYGNQGGQMILRAVGGSGQKVLDCTAGLARDAFILASEGCTVTAVEQSAVVAALANDALKRARLNPDVAKICERLRIICADSEEVLARARPGEYDAVYLDPMFPETKKTALPKKELRVLQQLLGAGDEETSRALLSKAGRIARRVIVKRPLRGPELMEGVSVSFKGSSTRFDVYIFS